MINTTEFGKNAVINSVVKEYAQRAKQENIDFNYNIISPPILSFSNEDLINMLSKVLSAMFAQKSSGVFLNTNVFSGKMQIECRSLTINAPSFGTEQVEAILSRNEGMLKSKFHNNEFIVQIVFPV